LDRAITVAAQSLSDRADEMYMAQAQYDMAALMGFQMSILCLGVALEQAAHVDSTAVVTKTLAEAERLKVLIESNQR
jgi:hypothetical protein